MEISKIVNSLHSPSYNPPRSGKDLSHRKVFTIKAGELLPILCEECIPEDYFEIDAAALVRSLTPLQTAAFVRCKVHLDFFFVPMTSIWRNFDAFYYQRQDNYTSYKQGNNYEPNINLRELVVAKNLGNDIATKGIRDSVAARAKILDLLGYGAWYTVENSSMAPSAFYGPIAEKSLTALPLFAYNRIFNLHYRNAWLDEPNADDIRSMSADCLDCSTYADSLVYAVDSLTDNPEIPGILQMHYHQYKQDLFQGLLPSQQFGVVSSIDINAVPKILTSTGNPVANRILSSDSSGNFSASSVSTNGQIPSSWSSAVVNFNIGSAFDIVTLRKAIAMQKWKEYNARAGWKAGQQQKAMFGVGEASDRVHDVEYIDSYQFPIMIDEVVQHSPSGFVEGVTTSPTALGDLGGKAIGIGNGHKIKFDVGKRWGYLMCIAYILPESEYNSSMIDKMLVRSTPDQHYMPAFANLGLEPVFKFELNAGGNPAVFDSTIGFTTRYHDYKTRVDKVYGDFRATKPLQHWVSSRRDLQNIINQGTIPVSYLYVNPSVLDTVFYSLSDGSLDTDQFMINCNFDVKAVRSMSDLGLPQF